MIGKRGSKSSPDDPYGLGISPGARGDAEVFKRRPMYAFYALGGVVALVFAMTWKFGNPGTGSAGAQRLPPGPPL